MRTLLATCCLALGLSSSWAADPYPSKPITMIVPQAPGGANDIVARALAQRLAVALGQPVVVDNKPGAGGNVGTALAARAPKDGYTLMITAQSAQTINPSLYKKVPFDPIKDFEPIMVVATAPYLLAVSPNFPAKNIKELIAMAKADPGKLTYASAGNGTVNHLLGEMLKSTASVDIVHVPYKGAAAAATDVIAGLCTMTFGSFPGVMPFVKSGQLRVIAAATEQRTALAPDMPTLAESVPGLHANAWYGLFAPAGTPKEVVTRLHQEIVKLLQLPEIKERFNALGAEVTPSTPDQLASLVKSDLVRWSKIVKDSGAQLD
jgi:tripartite-type tricarboxylate transporter receptor subunit TctC